MRALGIVLVCHCYLELHERCANSHSRSLLEWGLSSKTDLSGKTVCKHSFGKLTTENLIYYKMDFVHNSNVVL